MITTLADFLAESGHQSKHKKFVPIKNEEIDMAAAAGILKTRCPQFNPNKSPLFFRGRKTGGVTTFISDPSKRHRLSTAGYNHYGLLMDQLLNWDEYPRRNSSLIFSNSYYTAANYGECYMVFPLDNAKIGVSPTPDIFQSFTYLQSKLGLAITDFSSSVSSLGVHDTTWDIFRHDMDEMWDTIETSTSYQGALKSALIAEKKKGGDWLSYLQDLLDPVKNGFRLAKYDGAFLGGADKRALYGSAEKYSLYPWAVDNTSPSDPTSLSELWTDSPCLMVQMHRGRALYDAWMAQK